MTRIVESFWLEILIKTPGRVSNYDWQGTVLTFARSFPIRFLRNVACSKILISMFWLSRSQWPGNLRLLSAAARLLELRVRIPTGVQSLCLLCVVYFQVKVFLSGSSLVQRSSIDCGVSECDREASTMTGPCSNRGCRAMKKRILQLNFFQVIEMSSAKN
jgi:hypothetical protein